MPKTISHLTLILIFFSVKKADPDSNRDTNFLLG